MNLISLDDLSDADIEGLLEAAEGFAQDVRSHEHVLAGRIVCTAFFEPSTRTRLSFEAAAHRLGARCIGFADASTSSAAKGETLEDTIRVLAGYADAIVLRHPATGAAARAAQLSQVPIVNAGDGAGEHPTQALLDLFMMRRHFGRLEGLHVALVGDLRYGRTVHSLAPLLQRFGATVTQVPAPGLAHPEPLPEISLAEAAASADVLYVTRLQEERFTDAAALTTAKNRLRIDAGVLDAGGFQGIVMHPLPRVDELAADVDGHPSAKYFDQARNGVAVRMAVLAALLDGRLEEP